LGRRVAAIAIAAAWGATAAGATAQTIPPLPVETATLDNGLEVIVSTDTSAPIVAVNLRYAVGSGHEPAGRTGFAHLFEHLLFEETENLEDGELDRMITEAGGVVNGRTNTDRTEYTELVPSHHLERVLWTHAERMRRLRVSPELFERQRDIVKEERRLRIENQPYGEAQITLDTLAHDYAPYDHSVIGSMVDLDAAGVEDVRGFYDQWYRPNNARLVVVGHATMAEVLPMVERWFGAFERGPDPTPLPDAGPAAPPRTDGPRRAELEDGLALLPLVYLNYPIAGEGHPDVASLRVLGQILGGGDSSRLTRALVREARVASQIVSQIVVRSGPGLFVAGALAKTGVQAEVVERALVAEVERVATEGVTEEELRKAVDQLRILEVAELVSVPGKAVAIHAAREVYGDPSALGRGLDAITRVTVEEVRRVAARYLVEANRTVVVAGPPSGGDR
jgi:predicted Zn-dependent peptidase